MNTWTDSNLLKYDHLPRFFFFENNCLFVKKCLPPSNLTEESLYEHFIDPDAGTFLRLGYALIKFTYQNGKTIFIKYCFALETFFCFVVFHFCAASKNVFAAVSRFVGFVVSDSGHLCPRKLQNQQNERQRQKHFLRQPKKEKRQNNKCFKRKTVLH